MAIDPARNGQVTEALAKPWQAGASPRFVLPFLYCALAKQVPTSIASVDDAPGEIQNFISFLGLGAAVSDPRLLFLCSIARLNHTLHTIISKAVLEGVRPNLLRVWD